MCGIVGYIGQETKANTVLIKGLQALAYRGYDSAGIATIVNGQIKTYRAMGKVSALQDELKKQHAQSGYAGIAHTRWATHGSPSRINAHPHRVGSVTLVHNGIIENYLSLKQQMIAKGYHFQSDTDSEIAAAVIDDLYKSCHNKQRALAKAYRILSGSFAFAIIFDDELDALYAMRKQSPLVLGVGRHASYIGSDVSAFLCETNRYIELDHEEIARLDEQGIVVKNLALEFVTKSIKISDMNINDIQKGEFPHFMLKEIHEEPAVIQNIFHTYAANHILDLNQHLPDIATYEEVHIVACGSAMYAGMIAQQYLQEIGIRVSCRAASEYRYAKPYYHPNTLVLLISQSGETADTIAAMHMAKNHQIDTMAIVNAPESTIAKEADHVLYTNAGPEISVATTKAYCAQVAILSLLAIKFALAHQRISPQEILALEHAIELLPEQMKALIHDPQYKEATSMLYQHEHSYFIGRCLDYAYSMEGSLKLKEISYIHSEAYPAGELKHGTISLIEPHTPVIALCTSQDLYEKTISNIKEVRARGANILLLATEDLAVHKEICDYSIIIPRTHPYLQGILAIIPLQLIAYEVALLRGCEIDQPRNLAKSVTVE